METPNLDVIEEKIVRYCSLLASQVDFWDSEFPNGVSVMNELPIDECKRLLSEYQIIYSEPIVLVEKAEISG